MPQPELSAIVLEDARLTGWLRMVGRVPDEGFVPVNLHAPEFVELEAQSSGWAGNFLAPGVNPHDHSAARWEACAAPPSGGVDLLRCRYETRDLKLELIEGWNFLLLELPGAAVNADEQRVRELIHTVTHADAPWIFELPSALDDGRPLLLTTKGAPPVDALAGRFERADILLTDTDVWFVFYKIVEQRIGFSVDDGWFDNDQKAYLSRGATLQSTSPPKNH